MTPGSSRSFLAVPFFALFVYWAFLPTVQTVFFYAGNVPVDLRDCTLVGLAIFYAIAGRWWQRKSNNRWHFGLPWVTFLLLLYAAVSLFWSGIEPDDQLGMLWTLVLFGSGVSSAYTLISVTKSEHLHTLLRQIAFVLTVVTLVYAAESVFSLGLRSAKGTLIFDNFGIQRLAGPLFGPTTGYFILLPSLAIVLQDLFDRRGNPALNIFCAATFSVAILLTGSRGAVISSAVFVILVLFTIRISHKTFVLIGGLCVLSILAWTVVASVANVQRIEDFSDTAHLAIYRHAGDILAARPILVSLFGSGYGSIWPWYMLNAHLVVYSQLWQVATADGLISNANMMYHSHSVPLVLGVELGVFGLLYFVFICKILVQSLFKATRLNANVILSCGMVASGTCLLIDLFLFNVSRISFLWWLILFAWFRLNADRFGSASTPPRSRAITRSASRFALAVGVENGVRKRKGDAVGRPTRRFP